MLYLNNELHDSLVDRFGSVRVSGLGEEAYARRETSVDKEGRVAKRTQITGGEMYAVNCPFCGDSRQRLNISYTWGKEVYGNKVTHTAHCFNEQCDTSDLADYLKPYLYDIMPFIEKTAVVTSEQARPKVVELPGVLYSLTALDVEHHAIKYINSRWFSSGDLSNFHIMYCPHDYTEDEFFIADRLVFPFYLDGMVIGYQTRTLDPKATKYKYWIKPGTKKTYTFFGFGVQTITNRIVLVEGPFDVVRVGNGALGLSGKSISYYQIDLIKKYYPMIPVYIMLDPEAYNDAVKVRDKMVNAECLNEIHIIRLEAGDPADSSSAEIERSIREC